jgi:hypothetical protein
LIVNGGFETGDFAGWVLEDSGVGTFVINDGTFDPSSPDGPLPPYDGNFSALSDQTGPGTHILYQEVILPASGNPTLRWVDQIRNHGGVFEDPNQEYRVEIRDTDNNVLVTIFSTNPGDPLLQDWTPRSADLSTLGGQTVRIAFIEQDNLGYFNVHIDDVRMTGVNGNGTIPVAIAAGQVVTGVDFGNAYPGDTNGDRHVDFTDFTTQANNYTGPGGSGKDWTQGDFDGDGDVDFTDFTALANNFTGPVIGYSKGKSGGGLSEAQRAALLSSLEGADPSGSRAADVGESLAQSRARIALARLTTLRSRDAALAGIDRGSVHDAVLARLGSEESKIPRASSSRMVWVYEFEALGVKERPAKESSPVGNALNKLLPEDWL